MALVKAQDNSHSSAVTVNRYATGSLNDLISKSRKIRHIDIHRWTNEHIRLLKMIFGDFQRYKADGSSGKIPLNAVFVRQIQLTVFGLKEDSLPGFKEYAMRELFAWYGANPFHAWDSEVKM